MGGVDGCVSGGWGRVRRRRTFRNVAGTWSAPCHGAARFHLSQRGLVTLRWADGILIDGIIFPLSFENGNIEYTHLNRGLHRSSSSLPTKMSHIMIAFTSASLFSPVQQLPRMASRYPLNNLLRISPVPAVRWLSMAAPNKGSPRNSRDSKLVLI